MTSDKPKTNQELISYLRSTKGIYFTSGSYQKNRFASIGYYHGYKGYRYIRKPSNHIRFSKFEELLAIYDFDSQMKAIFYPCVMQIETAFKNYVLEVILDSIHSYEFADIYNQLLDDFKRFSPTGATQKDYKEALKARMELRNRFYRIQTDAFCKNNPIATHFLEKNINPPIWAMFELITLGEFGQFVSCLNLTCRRKISTRLGIKSSDDTNAVLTRRLIYATKDLRNAIAHNDIVFDSRFKRGAIDKQVSSAISNETLCSNVTFDTITDYLILLVFQLKHININKPELLYVISAFKKATEKLRKQIPTSIYNQIIFTDNSAKIKKLEEYINR